MSTITREFTKEQLQQIIETDHVQCGEASALARIALASLEAEPVFEVEVSGNHWLNAGPVEDSDFSGMPDGVNQLYSAPPGPVSLPTFDEWLEIRGNKPLGWVKDAMRESYDACRAAMLQGGKS